MTGAPVDVKSLSFKDKLEILRSSVLNPVRRPAQVLLCAADILANYNSSLTEAERCTIYEQATIAALDCGNDRQAEAYFLYLKNKFGSSSNRVRRLFGLILEARGKVNEARNLYYRVLNDEPVDNFVAKRLCAMYRAEGKISNAIDVLEKNYVFMYPPALRAEGTGKPVQKYSFQDIYPTDEAAYRELISLHWLNWKLSECVRCAEELLLFDPVNYMHHTRVAELYYIDGNLPRALTSYAHSVRLNNSANNIRAMYGVWLIATHFATITSTSAKGRSTKESPQAFEESNTAWDDAPAYSDAVAMVEFAEQKLRASMNGSPLMSGLDLMLSRNVIKNKK